MTAEEEALMTQLAQGPVAEADLDEATRAAAGHLAGRNVVTFYPMSDGSEGRQIELTQVGEMYVESPQEEQQPPPEEPPPLEAPQS